MFAFREAIWCNGYFTNTIIFGFVQNRREPLIHWHMGHMRKIVFSTIRPSAAPNGQRIPRGWNTAMVILPYENGFMTTPNMGMSFIWGNYNISQTWIKAIWGWFPLITIIPVRSQWGHYNLPRYGYVIYVIQLLTMDHLVVLWTPKHPSRIAPVDDTLRSGKLPICRGFTY